MLDINGAGDEKASGGWPRFSSVDSGKMPQLSIDTADGVILFFFVQYCFFFYCNATKAIDVVKCYKTTLGNVLRLCSNSLV